jgi:hypothetical protein
MRIVPPVWGHTRWQWGRGGSAGSGDRTPSRPSPMITAAPILTSFSTNYLGTGCVATCRHVRSMAASSARRMRSQRDIPQLCGGPLQGPTQSACTTTLREDPQQRFPQSVGVGSWPRKSALTGTTRPSRSRWATISADTGGQDAWHLLPDLGAFSAEHRATAVGCHVPAVTTCGGLDLHARNWRHRSPCRRTRPPR